MKLNFFQKLKPSGGHAPDYLLITVFGIFVLFGLLMLSSAGTAIGFEKFGDSYYFVKHQLIYGILPGTLLLLFFSWFPYQKLKPIAPLLLIASIVLLISVFIPGVGAQFGTARSWIHLGNYSLQPSEFVKLTFLIYLAAWLEKRGESGIRDFYYGLMPFIFTLGIISLLMIKQPDLGTLSIIIFMAMAVLYASGARLKHVLGLVAAGFTAIYFLIQSSPYRAARLTTFLHPELDPQGIGYHINQAFLAIGSGGIFGRGFGHSRQKFLYLPEATGDSIFAILAEELGFVFSVVIIGLFLFILVRGIKIAQNAPDKFGQLMATGIIAWITFQAFFNIGSMLGVLPMTGVPLPFISYGGTAITVGMAAMGILINISRYTQKSHQ